MVVEEQDAHTGHSILNKVEQGEGIPCVLNLALPTSTILGQKEASCTGAVFLLLGSGL